MGSQPALECGRVGYLKLVKFDTVELSENTTCPVRLNSIAVDTEMGRRSDS